LGHVRASQFTDTKTILRRLELAVEDLRLILVEINQGLSLEHIEIRLGDLEKNLGFRRLQSGTLGYDLVFLQPPRRRQF